MDGTEQGVSKGKSQQSVVFNLGESESFINEQISEVLQDDHMLFDSELDSPHHKRTVRFDIGEGEDHEQDSGAPLLEEVVHHHAEPHKMYIELYDLTFGHGGEAEWQETARWIKYEEDAEGLDHHWGRPHVAFLSFHALLQLRKCVAKGVVSLDLEARTFDDVCEHIASSMAEHFSMDEERASVIMSSLHKKHKRAHDAHVHLPHMPSMQKISSQISLGRRMTTIEEASREGSRAPSHAGSMMKVNGERGQTEAPIDREIAPAPREATDYDQTSEPRPLVRQLSGIERQRTRADSSKSPFMPRRLSRSRLGGIMGNKTPSFMNMNLARVETEEILRIVPRDAEAAQVFVGVLKELQGARFAMVRLAQGVEMPELLEAPIPIRFLFVILGPNLADIDYHELGRAISTLMSNPHFHEIAYRAESREELITAIDEFLDESIVVPPGDIDNKQLLAPEQIKKALKKRKLKRTEALERLRSEQRSGLEESTEEITVAKKVPKGPVNPLKRTGVLFGGMVRDIKNRLPHYISDYRDALNFQCLTAMIFMFFAAFAPAITFGGLMGNYTKDAMGITETLLAQCLCGVIWGLFSAQPLLIMSATGPVLIFEASLYAFCDTLGLNFLVVRVWAGVWLATLAFVTVMLEGAFLVSYVTRFTEDIFAILISCIFISESIKFLQKTFKRHPVMNMEWYMLKRDECIFLQQNRSAFLAGAVNSTQPPTTDLMLTNDTSINSTLINDINETMALIGAPFEGCEHHFQPDTALLTAILLFATFSLAYYLKKLRTSYFLSRTVSLANGFPLLRSAIGDFGVLIAIVVVSLFDVLIFNQPYLRRIDMPDSFSFTNATARGGNGTIFISTDLGKKWWQSILFALVPALLVYILLFVETEITQVLLSKKERGLRKGNGFHWDLLLMGFLALVCSLLGLPWMCAAAVQSLAHASSLTVMKRHAPGERAAVDYVIEQRVTTIGVALLVGACAFAGKALAWLPLCVLFGVFLYLGVMNLVGVQFLNRIVLLFIPEKYFPDVAYCQNVSMWRMHLYTGIQILSLVGVYIVKYFKQSSLAFPFVLMFTAVIRMVVLPKIFTTAEIRALDAHEEEIEDEFNEADLYEEAHGWGM